MMEYSALTWSVPNLGGKLRSSWINCAPTTGSHSLPSPVTGAMALPGG